MENTSLVCVLGPWPREGLSLAFASKFFCVLGLGLEPCVLDSTSAVYKRIIFVFVLKLVHSRMCPVKLRERPPFKRPEASPLYSLSADHSSAKTELN